MIPMDGKALKKQVIRWAAKVGPQRAKVALVAAGIGLSTAEKLAADNYASVPRGETAFKLAKLLKDEGELEEQAS